MPKQGARSWCGLAWNSWIATVRVTLHAYIDTNGRGIQIQPDPPPPPSSSKRHWPHRLTPQIAARYLQPVSWAAGLLVLAHPTITPEHLARDGCVVRILIERVCRLDFLGVLVPPGVTQASAWRRANG